MDIKQLRYFVTVVEEGNISAAAKKLHICQPPLSHQMKMIEQELGVRLMERGSRKITLNESGKLLYKRAKNIISLMEAALKEIEDLKNGYTGSISIGLASSCNLSLIQEFIVSYHEEYPQVNFKFVEGSTKDILEALNNGEVELAIVRTPFNHDGLYNTSILKEPMVAVYNHKFDLGDKDSLSIDELKEVPLIVYRRFEETINNSFYKQNIEPYIFCLNDDAKTALTCAKNGLGVAILPYSSVDDSINEEGLTIKEITDEDLKTEIKVVYSKKHFLSRISQGLLEKIKEYHN